MSELLDRLNETHKVCSAAYENWKDDRKNPDKREGLATAVHELRKVASDDHLPHRRIAKTHQMMPFSFSD